MRLLFFTFLLGLMITDDAHATDTTTVAEYNVPERNVTEAKPITEIKNLPDAPLARSKRLIHLAEQDIQSNKMLAEQLLNQTIERGNPDAIENVLKIDLHPKSWTKQTSN